MQELITGFCACQSKEKEIVVLAFASEVVRRLPRLPRRSKLSAVPHCGLACGLSRPATKTPIIRSQLRVLSSSALVSSLWSYRGGCRLGNVSASFHRLLAIEIQQKLDAIDAV